MKRYPWKRFTSKIRETNDGDTQSASSAITKHASPPSNFPSSGAKQTLGENDGSNKMALPTRLIAKDEGLSADANATRSDILPGSELAKKDYWRLAADELRAESALYKQLLAIMELEATCNGSDEAEQLAIEVERSRKALETRQLKVKLGAKEIKIRDQLAKILKAVQLFRGVGTAAANLDPLHAGLPWAGVCLLMQLVTSDFEQYEAMISGAAQVSTIISRYHQIEVLYTSRQETNLKVEFESRLILLYKGILRYQINAVCYYRRGASVRILRSFPRMDDPSQILADIQLNDRACKDIGQVFDSEDAQLRHQEILTIFRAYDDKITELVTELQDKDNQQALMNETRLEEKRQKLIDSLYFPQMETRLDDPRIEAYDRTCAWIFDRSHCSFTKWLEEGEGIFWITGKPGSGKSTLMRFIYESKELEQHAQFWCGTSKFIVATFFLWHLGSDLQRSQEGLLRAILYNVMRGRPELVDAVFDEELRALDTFRASEEPWTLKRLKQSLRNLVEKTDSKAKIFLLIDGLDEYTGEYADLTALFKDISKNKHVKMCLASRPEKQFEEDFEHHQQLLMQEWNEEDILGYVQASFTQNDRWNRLPAEIQSHKTTLAREITSKANGVFLWVRLVVKDLLNGLQLRDQHSQLQQRLQRLPPDLFDLYRTLLDKIDPLYHPRRNSFLAVLVDAQNLSEKYPRLNPKGFHSSWWEIPTVLTVLDMLALFEISFKSNGLFPGIALDGPHLQQQFLDMKERLSSHSSFLIETYPCRSAKYPQNLGFHVVNFYHRTVKDFLEVCSADQESWIESNRQESFTQYLSYLPITILKSFTFSAEGFNDGSYDFYMDQSCSYRVYETQILKAVNFAKDVSDIDLQGRYLTELYIAASRQEVYQYLTYSDGIDVFLHRNGGGNFVRMEKNVRELCDMDLQFLTYVGELGFVKYLQTNIEAWNKPRHSLAKKEDTIADFQPQNFFLLVYTAIIWYESIYDGFGYGLRGTQNLINQAEMLVAMDADVNAQVGSISQFVEFTEDTFPATAGKTDTPCGFIVAALVELAAVTQKMGSGADYDSDRHASNIAILRNLTQLLCDFVVRGANTSDDGLPYHRYNKHIGAPLGILRPLDLPEPEKGKLVGLLLSRQSESPANLPLVKKEAVDRSGP